MRKREIEAYIYAFLCVLLWALIPVCSKKVLLSMDNFAFLFFSSLISAVTLGIYILLSSKSRLFRLYCLKDYFYMSFLGFLGSFLFYVFLYRAFSMAGAQEVFIINYLWPILIVLFSSFILNERLTLLKLFAVLISFSGVWVIVTRGRFSGVHFSSLGGDAFALMAAVSFALFSVMGRKFSFDETISVFVYFVTSSILSLVFVPFFHIRSLSLESLFWLFVNGVFVNGISYIFWFAALKKGRVHLVSNTVYLTPFLALVFIALFLGERVKPYSLLALALIVSGIVIQAFAEYRRKSSPI